MQYFQAVQAGKKRAGRSQMRLFEVAGFAMLTLTTKKVNEVFVPVGEEEFAAVIQNQDGFIVIIVDGDGFTKAQTRPVEMAEARQIYSKLTDSGLDSFSGDEIEIWTERYPVVRLESS